MESTEGQECAPTSSPLAAPSGATSQSPPKCARCPRGASPCCERQDQRPCQTSPGVSRVEDPRRVGDGRALEQGQACAAPPPPTPPGSCPCSDLASHILGGKCPPLSPFLGTSQWLNHTAFPVPYALGQIYCDGLSRPSDHRLWFNTHVPSTNSGPGPRRPDGGGSLAPAPPWGSPCGLDLQLPVRPREPVCTKNRAARTRALNAEAPGLRSARCPCSSDACDREEGRPTQAPSCVAVSVPSGYM